MKKAKIKITATTAMGLFSFGLFALLRIVRDYVE